MMRKNGKLVAAVGAVALLALAMVSVPACVSAGGGPIIVLGYVWDNAGNNISGANVVVEIKDPSTGSTKATMSDTTDKLGQYSVTFGQDDWNNGDWINVTVNFQGKQTKNSSVAIEGRPFVYINATYPFEIPDLGSVAGFAIAGACLGGVAIFLIVRRKKE